MAYEKWVKYHKFEGKHIYYKVGEPDCPPYTVPHWHLKVGDYLVDQNGIVAPVLAIERSDRIAVRKKVQQNILKVYTPFGRDTVAYTNKYYAVLKVPNFKRDRLAFSSTCGKGLKRLTHNDRLFLWHCLTEDPADAYVKAGGNLTRNTKFAARTKLKRILECPEAKEVLKSMLQDLIKSKGFDKVEFYLNKLEESIQGPIKTSVQFEILKTIAKASGSDEVIQLMAPEDGGAPPPLLNTGEPDEAPFEVVEPLQLSEAVDA